MPVCRRAFSTRQQNSTACSSSSKPECSPMGRYNPTLAYTSVTDLLSSPSVDKQRRLLTSQTQARTVPVESSAGSGKTSPDKTEDLRNTSKNNKITHQRRRRWRAAPSFL